VGGDYQVPSSLLHFSITQKLTIMELLISLAIIYIGYLLSCRWEKKTKRELESRRNQYPQASRKSYTDLDNELSNYI